MRAFIGISYGDIEPELASRFRLPVREGIMITGVVRGSPGDEAGLRAQDIVTRIDDREITRGGDLRRELRARRPGDTIRLTVVRPSGTATVHVLLAEAND